MLHSIALVVALSTGQIGVRNNGVDGGMAQQRIDAWSPISADVYNGSVRLRLDGGFMAATVAPVDLYVATSGNNDNACTSPASPCADPNGAFAKLPHFIRHGVNVYLAAGAYDAGTKFYGFEISDDAYVTLQGPDGGNPSTLASGLTSGTIASFDAGPNLTYQSVTVTGAGWTANDLSDRFMFITLPDAGVLEPTPIVSNSSDTALFNIVLNSAGSSVAPDPGSTFMIRQPSATLFMTGNGPPAAFQLGNYAGRLYIRDLDFLEQDAASQTTPFTSGEFSIGIYPPGATSMTGTPPSSAVGDRAELNLSRSRVINMGNGGSDLSLAGGFRVQVRNTAFFAQPITGTGVSTCYSQFGSGRVQSTDVFIVNASCTSRRLGWSFFGGLSVALSRVSQRMFYQINATGGGIAVSGPGSTLSLSSTIVSCNQASNTGVEGVVNTGARLSVSSLRVNGCMSGVYTKHGGYTQIVAPSSVWFEGGPQTGYYNSPGCGYQAESGGRIMLNASLPPTQANFSDAGYNIGDVCVPSAQVSFTDFADGGFMGLMDLSNGATVGQFTNF